MTSKVRAPQSETAREAALDGRQVFEILVRENTGMLLGYLRSLLRTPDAVDDLFQETMLTAWRRLPDYDQDRPFGPWLRGIAVRLVLKHRERLARAAPQCDPAVLEALEQRYAASAASPEHLTSVLERLRACVQHLPAKLRAVIAMVYDQGLQLREVGTALEATEEAVKKRVQRGRALLAECLRRTGAAT